MEQNNPIAYWTKAAEDPMAAVMAFYSCVRAGYIARLVAIDNSDPSLGYNAIRVINPALEDPFNWEASYSSFGTGDERGRVHLSVSSGAAACSARSKYEDMARYMSENYTSFYGTEEAAAAYRANKAITRDMHLLATDAPVPGAKYMWYPVHKADANKWRQDFHPEAPYDYVHSPFMSVWHSICPREIPDPDIGTVYAVTFKMRDEVEEAVSVEEQLDDAMKFLASIKERMEYHE